MATAQQENTQIQILQRADIRTMKKDLKHLREVDADKESKKIMGLKFSLPGKKPFDSAQGKPVVVQKVVGPTTAPVRKVPAVPQTAVQEGPLQGSIGMVQKISLEEIKELAKKTERDLEMINDMVEEKLTVTETEQNAKEQEKQQIFQLETQKTDLEKKVQEQEKHVLTAAQQREKILQNQKILRQKLALIIEEQKAAPEGEKEELEKKRWPVEQEIAKLQKELDGMEATVAISKEKKQELQGKISHINNSLKSIFLNIAKTKREILKESELAVHKRPAQQAPAPKPQTAVEKMQQAAKVEEEQRRRFMEDVERWANIIKKEQAGKPIDAHSTGSTSSLQASSGQAAQ